MMSEKELQNELARMLQAVTLNAGYHRYIQSMDILVQDEFYIQICQLIFPEININLVKIFEDRTMNSGQKLQQLIDQLGKLLKFEKLSIISGPEIVSGNIQHIYWLLGLLVDCSQRCIQKVNESVSSKGKRIKTDPDRTLRDEEDRRNISSALGGMQKKEQKTYEHYSNQPAYQQDYHQQYQQTRLNKHDPYLPQNQQQNQEAQSKSSQLRPSDPQNIRSSGPVQQNSLNKQKLYPQQQPAILKSRKRPRSAYQYSNQKKHRRSVKAERKNFYQSVVNIFADQKHNTMVAANRDQRKNKNRDIQQAKLKYNTYLKNYVKENKVKKNKLNMERQPKQNRRQLRIDDFAHIQNFFESFSYKFRDQKTAYLKHIQRLVKKQQTDRMCYKNRIQRQIKGDMQRALQKQVQSANYQHGVKVNMIKQVAKKNQRQLDMMRKANQQLLRQQKRQLKQQKKKQLSTIESFIKQQNDKVLMQMQVGGRLDQLIINLYKRY